MTTTTATRICLQALPAKFFLLVALGVGNAHAGDFEWDTTQGTCRFNTLNDAVTNADNNGQYGATIYAKPGTYTLAGTLTWAYISADTTHTLRPGLSNCTGNALSGVVDIVAPANHRAFVVGINDTLTLVDVTVSGGSPPINESGGNILVKSGGTLNATNVTIANADADDADGGCIATESNGTLGFTNVTVSGCFADYDGGAIFLDDGSTLTWTTGLIDDAEALVNGGGIAAVESSIDLTGVSVTGEASMGGGIHLADSSAVLSASSVIDSIATSGGGVAAVGTSVASSVDLFDDSAILYNTAGNGAGMWLDAPSEATLNDTSHIDHNLATVNGGGAYLISPSGAGDVTFTLLDESYVEYNDAGDQGGGAYLTAWDASNAWLLGFDQSSISNNTAYDGAGIFLDGPVEADLRDLVTVSYNTAENDGGGVYLFDNLSRGAPLLECYGDEVFAASGIGDTTDGVRFVGNSATGVGSALFSTDGGVAVAENLVVHGSDSIAVVLEDGSSLTAGTSHFNENEDVFDLADSDLSLYTAWPEGCDVFNSLAYYPDRYCSEVSGNTGALFDATGTSTATFLTTAFMENTGATAGVLLRVRDDVVVDMTTCLVGSNSATTPTAMVQVDSGGDLTARQNSFGANTSLPVTFASGSTADVRRNIFWESSTVNAAVVTAGASITGNCNFGKWNGGLSGTNNTDPLWVTTARGDFHLNGSSAVLDVCTTDGPYDIEGTSRPIPNNGNWDVGAIEYNSAN